MNVLRFHIYPELRKYPVENVTLHKWLEMLEKLANKTPTTANLALNVCRRALKWGVRRKLIKVNELANVEVKEDLNISINFRSRLSTRRRRTCCDT